MTVDELDQHILEWGIEIDGRLYFDGCSNAEDGCSLCAAIDAKDQAESRPAPAGATEADDASL